MNQIINSKPPKIFNLEQRTIDFSKRVFEYIEKLPKNLINAEVSKQLIRSAASIGANYIEANESLGKKDFVMKIRISKREAKESCYWLKLSRPLVESNEERSFLIQEVTELMKIFGAIVEKSKG